MITWAINGGARMDGLKLKFGGDRGVRDAATGSRLVTCTSIGRACLELAAREFTPHSDRVAYKGMEVVCGEDQDHDVMRSDASQVRRW